ncbi:MAG: MmgE/PrpD family protein [Pseudomonadota bacterium]
MTTPVARQFARFACTRTGPPAKVVHAADRAMLDTLGAIIVGGTHPATLSVAGAFAGSDGPATLTTGGTASVQTAALVNGMAAHVWDIDDTSYTGIMHGSAVILPALLAVADDTGADADAVRDAFIIGSEITYVLADICTHQHYFHGWWSTVTFSLVGATAAVGVLLGLNEDQMVSAIGLAAAAAGGGKAVFGTDGKPFLVGDAAQRAIAFARVAAQGLSGPETAFEDDRGFLKLLNNGKSELRELETLGQRWRLVDPGLLFKTNPVCSAAHAAIDQMNALMTELDAQPGDTAQIRAEVPKLVDISLVYPRPTTPQQAQFSLPYTLACTALHGRVRFEDLDPDVIQSADITALMEKITVVRADDLSTEEMRQKFPESARLILTLTDGRSAQGFCGVAKGMPTNPLSDEELIKKFDAAVTYAGRTCDPDTRLGDHPAQIFARRMGRSNCPIQGGSPS